MMEKFGVIDICPVCQSNKIKIEKVKVSNAFEHYEETQRVCTCGYKDVLDHQDFDVPLQ